MVFVLDDSWGRGGWWCLCWMIVGGGVVGGVCVG